MANLSQVFKVAGITTHGDTSKVRFTDDMVRRIKQFTKGGATRCDLIELPSAMTKLEALVYLKTHPDFLSPADQATIEDAIGDKTPVVKAVKTPKVPKEPKVTKTKEQLKATPSLSSIKARGKKPVTVTEPEATTETVTTAQE